MRTAGLADEPLTIEQPVTAPSSLVIEEVGDLSLPSDLIPEVFAERFFTLSKPVLQLAYDLYRCIIIATTNQDHMVYDGVQALMTLARDLDSDPAQTGGPSLRSIQQQLEDRALYNYPPGQRTILTELDIIILAALEDDNVTEAGARRAVSELAKAIKY